MRAGRGPRRRGQRIPDAGGLALILGHLGIDQHEAVIRDERVRRHGLVPAESVLAAVARLPVRVRGGPVPEVRGDLLDVHGIDASPYGSGYGVSGRAPAVRLRADDRALPGFRPDLANLWHEGGLHRVVGGRGSVEAPGGWMSSRSTRRRAVLLAPRRRVRPRGFEPDPVLAPEVTRSEGFGRRSPPTRSRCSLARSRRSRSR